MSTIEVTIQAGPTIEVTVEDQIQIVTTVEQHSLEVEFGPGGLILDVAGTNTVIGEVPTGAINGSNVTFNTLNDFVPGNVRPFVSGVPLTIINDFQTIGTDTIQLVTPPQAGESVTVDYLRA